jgi:nucleoside-diphosphate-sugar epimerase
MFANMARLISRRRFLLVGSGENRVNLLFVGDLAEGLARCLLEPEALGQDFVFAGPETVPIQHMAAVIAGAVGRALPRLSVPAGPARLAARMMEAGYRGLGLVREPFLTRAKIDLLTCEDIYDTSKARTRLGFTPRVSLAEGVLPTVRWLRERGELG